MVQPLVNVHSLRTGSHGPVEIVDLPIYKAWWIFPQLRERLPDGGFSFRGFEHLIMAYYGHYVYMYVYVYMLDMYLQSYLTLYVYT